MTHLHNVIFYPSRSMWGLSAYYSRVLQFAGVAVLAVAAILIVLNRARAVTLGLSVAAAFFIVQNLLWLSGYAMSFMTGYRHVSTWALQALGGATLDALAGSFVLAALFRSIPWVKSGESQKFLISRVLAIVAIVITIAGSWVELVASLRLLPYSNDLRVGGWFGGVTPGLLIIAGTATLLMQHISPRRRTATLTAFTVIGVMSLGAASSWLHSPYRSWGLLLAATEVGAAIGAWIALARVQARTPKRIGADTGQS